MFAHWRSQNPVRKTGVSDHWKIIHSAERYCNHIAYVRLVFVCIAYSSSSLNANRKEIRKNWERDPGYRPCFSKIWSTAFWQSRHHSTYGPQASGSDFQAFPSHRLQSIILSLQRYSFLYHKGSALLIADTLPMSLHEPQLRLKIWFTELISKVTTPIYQLSQMSPSRTSASQPQQIEQIALRTLVESGWPTNKASVPESVRLYWDVRSELKSHEGLLYKQDRVIIPTALPSSVLHKYMQLTVALILLFATLVIPFSGLV